MKRPTSRQAVAFVALPLICLLVPSVTPAIADCSNPAVGPTVVPNSNDYAERGAGFRARDLSNTATGGNFYLGIPDLGQPGTAGCTRREDLTSNPFWTIGGAGDRISLTYTGQPSDKITAEIDLGNNGTVDRTLSFPLDPKSLTQCLTERPKLYRPPDFNVLNIYIKNRPGVTISYQNVTLDGNPLGSFFGGAFGPIPGAGENSHWLVTNYDFSQGFTIVGELHIDGVPGGGSETNTLEVYVGHRVHVDIETDPSGMPQCNPVEVHANKCGDPYAPQSCAWTFANCTPGTTPSFLPDPGSPDNCGGHLDFGGGCPPARSCDVTVTMTDSKGGRGTDTLAITVNDETPPTVTAPPDVTVDCGHEHPSEAGEGTATDNCTPNLAPVWSDGPLDTAVECPLRHSFVRTWEATDDCGNQGSALQTISVNDEAPVLENVPPSPPDPVECDVPLTDPVVARDGCDPTTILPHRLDSTRTPGTCPNNYTLTRTWSADSKCFTATAQQVIQIVDTTPPALIGVPGDAQYSCAAEVPPPPSVTATDNCDEEGVPVEYSETKVDGPCVDKFTLTRTWSATDSCGNRVERSQRIVVSDDHPPVLLGVPPDESYECAGAVPPPPTVTANDNCDPAPVVTYSEQTIPGDCANRLTIVRTWTAEDRCSNVATARQTITVNDDVAPAVDVYLQPLRPVPPAAACVPASRLVRVVCQASDNCGGAPTVTAKVTTWISRVNKKPKSCSTQWPPPSYDGTVNCGDIIWVHILPPQCSNAGKDWVPFGTDRYGMVVRGEMVKLSGAATDACANQATDTFNPRCEEPPSGSCPSQPGCCGSMPQPPPPCPSRFACNSPTCPWSY